jgi:hypothetical protein
MEEITAKLADTFGGQASEKADTFAGKMDRLKVAFNESKETVGAFVLDAITPMVTGFVNTVIPAVQKLAEELGPKLTPIFKALTEYISNFVIPTFKAIWQFITEFLIPAMRDFFTPIINGLRDAFEQVTVKIKENEEQLKPLLAFFRTVATFVRDVLAPVLGVVLGAAFKVMAQALGIIIDNLVIFVTTINAAYTGLKKLIKLMDENPLVLSSSGAVGFGLQKIFGGGRANGGPVSSGTSYMVGERGPELFVPNTSGTIIPNGSGGAGSTINLTVNGAIDAEGTARTIVDVLNRSFSRGTLGSLNFQT